MVIDFISAQRTPSSASAFFLFPRTGAWLHRMTTTKRTDAGFARSSHRVTTGICGSRAAISTARSAPRRCCSGGCHAPYAGWHPPLCSEARSIHQVRPRRPRTELGILLLHLACPCCMQLNVGKVHLVLVSEQRLPMQSQQAYTTFPQSTPGPMVL